jgi:hypothetical protein
LNVSTGGGYSATDGDSFGVLTAGLGFGHVRRGQQDVRQSAHPHLQRNEPAAGDRQRERQLVDIRRQRQLEQSARWSLGHVPLAGEQAVIDRSAGVFTITVPREPSMPAC